MSIACEEPSSHFANVGLDALCLAHGVLKRFVDDVFVSATFIIIIAVEITYTI